MIPSTIAIFLVGQRITVCKAVVDHDQERIKAGGRGEISDEITRQLLEWTGGGGADGVKGRYCGVRVGLGLLAISAAFDIFSDELSEARPPIVSHHELAGFEISRVAGRGVIVASGHNILVKGPGGWDVYPPWVGKEFIT